MYIYVDKNNYIYGYGSEWMDNSVEVECIPSEVDKHLGAYKFVDGEYVKDQDRINYQNFLNTTELALRTIEMWLKDEYPSTLMAYERQKRRGDDVDALIEALDNLYDENVEQKDSLTNKMAMSFDQWKESINELG